MLRCSDLSCNAAHNVLEEIIFWIPIKGPAQLIFESVQLSRGRRWETLFHLLHHWPGYFFKTGSSGKNNDQIKNIRIFSQNQWTRTFSCSPHYSLKVDNHHTVVVVVDLPCPCQSSCLGSDRSNHPHPLCHTQPCLQENKLSFYFIAWSSSWRNSCTTSSLLRWSPFFFHKHPEKKFSFFTALECGWNDAIATLWKQDPLAQLTQVDERICTVNLEFKKKHQGKVW